MNEVQVKTLGGINLVATHVSRSLSAPEPMVEFRTAEGALVASCAVGRLGGRLRFFSLRPEDPAWDLGPVDIARIKRMVAEVAHSASRDLAG